jgi:hypothetical protein
MIGSARVSLTSKIAVAVAALACVFVLSVTVAVGAEAVVRYQKESMQAYEGQLASGQIQAATFNKKVRSLHLLLNNGSHVLTIYPPHDEPTLVAALTAKHVPVTILKPADASKEAASKPVHHKLRYIAGGILVVVIVVVAAVLLVDRRRKLAAE